MRNFIIIAAALCLLLSCRGQKEVSQLSGKLQTPPAVETPQKFMELSVDNATFLINSCIKGKFKLMVFPKLDKIFIQVGEETPIACPFNTNFECSLNGKNSLEFVKLYTGNICIRQVYPPDELDDATLFDKPETIITKRRDSLGQPIQYLVFASDELHKQIRCKKENSVITLCFIEVKGKKKFYRVDLDDFKKFNAIQMELDISSMRPSLIYGK